MPKKPLSQSTSLPIDFATNTKKYSKKEDEYSMYKKTHRAEVKMSDFLKVVKGAAMKSKELERHYSEKLREDSIEKETVKCCSLMDHALTKTPSFTLVSFKNDPGRAVGYEIEADDIADGTAGLAIADCRDDTGSQRGTGAHSSEYGHVINDCSAPAPVPSSLPPLPDDDSLDSSPRAAAAYASTAATATLKTSPSEGSEDSIPDPPKDLVCPITGDLMIDPVVAADGYTYERAAITNWFRRFPVFNCPRSPTTNADIKSRMLFPNYNVRSQCREFARLHGIRLESKES